MQSYCDITERGIFFELPTIPIKDRLDPFKGRWGILRLRFVFHPKVFTVRFINLLTSMGLLKGVDFCN